MLCIFPDKKIFEKDAVFSLKILDLLGGVIKIWSYAHPLLHTLPSSWYDSFVYFTGFTGWVDFASYSFVWNVPFGRCKCFSFGLNRHKKKLFWSVISLHFIYKNIQFRFAKPNMSSKIVGWLVRAQDGNILGFKKKNLNNSKNVRKNQEMVNTKVLPVLIKFF